MTEQLVLPLDIPNERPTPMSEYTSVWFWKIVAERAVKTAAQTAVALIGAEAFDVLVTDWTQLASVSAGAAVVSVLSSVASARVGERGDPSLV